jgi:hypothetical protein
MARRLNGGSRRPASDRTHVQDGPCPVRSDHSNLGPGERTPHPTAHNRFLARRALSNLQSPGHAGAR